MAIYEEKDEDDEEEEKKEEELNHKAKNGAAYKVDGENDGSVDRGLFQQDG